MSEPDDALLEQARRHAATYLGSLPDRPVGPGVDPATITSRLPSDLPDDGAEPTAVVDELVEAVEPGLVASAGPRYFGFVVGGSVPAAVAADWLTSAWDQNAGLYLLSPAASTVEELTGRWVLDLLGLPVTASFGFVTGATMANFSGLAAARRAVLTAAGHDLERSGLAGCPPVRVLVGEERHATVDVALRYLGIGSDQVVGVEVDGHGAMRPDALRAVLDGLAGAPTIVCAQAGNVNTGAVDPVGEVCALAHARAAWVHLDGAFGLWAQASPTLRALTAGAGEADSWATDFHKWLNVPYDSGFVAVRDPDAHRAALRKSAAYLLTEEGRRDGDQWTPEGSQRARAFAVYAALRQLGRRGVADLVDRCCAHARRFAVALAAEPGVEVLDDVVLNQVLVRFDGAPGGDGDAHTTAVLADVQAGGVAWLGTTVWRGRTAARISVSGWRTTEADVDRTVAALLDAHRRLSSPA